MKITTKQLIDSTNIPPSLVRAVVKQLGGWESFKESAPDITNHGINGGFHGFIYHTDTVAFAKRHKRDIAAMAADQAYDFGTTTLEMIQGFNCLNEARYSLDTIGKCLYGRGCGNGEETDIYNALAWYAGEEVARAYCDLTER